MIGLYNWLICRLFKRCELHVTSLPSESFRRYCEENPWAAEAKIFDL
jgi:hypothetical protein